MMIIWRVLFENFGSLLYEALQAFTSKYSHYFQRSPRKLLGKMPHETYADAAPAVDERTQLNASMTTPPTMTMSQPLGDEKFIDIRLV